MKRRLAIGVFTACLLVAPLLRAQAQVAETVLKCTKSLTTAIACVVIEGTVAKAVDIGLDKLVALALGRLDKLEPGDLRPSGLLVADIEARGIGWADLKESLRSIFKSDTTVDDQKARALVADSCRKSYQPVCRYLGIPEPREIVDCTKLASKQACEALFACSWKGTVCGRNGGTRELFGR